VVHSLTKYIGGHGTRSGMIIDSANFLGRHAKRFPMLNQPEPAYHGVIYTEALGAAAVYRPARTVPLEEYRLRLSPFMPS